MMRITQIINNWSHSLTNARFLPWRWRYQGGPLNTLIQRPARQKKLLEMAQQGTKNDITVLYGVKNRVDHKLVNSLKSLKQQDYPGDLIKIVIVDYGSEADALNRLKEICKQFDAELIETSLADKEWNRPNCLNIGLRAIQTRFTLSCDCDIIFDTHYISEVVNTLTRSPLSAVYSQCLDLGPESDDYLKAVSQADSELDYHRLSEYSEARTAGNMHAGINASYTVFYQYIQGYDEFYHLWGSEDNDLKKRFQYLGLESRSIANTTKYYHQWHPKYAGVKTPELEAVIHQNDQYFRNNHSIIRNNTSWGQY